MAVVNSAKFNFAEVVQGFLKQYGYDVAEEVFEGVDEVSKETVKRLRKASRAAVGGTGAYAKGWTRTVEQGRVKVLATIHGSTRATWAKAHLLEFGHANRDGGRTDGRPHIAAVNDWAQDEAVDRIVSKLEGRI